MNYVRFGSTGMKVSPICLGCMSYGDTAASDGPFVNEDLVGEALTPFRSSR